MTEAGPVSAQLITELKVPYQVPVGALAPNLEAKVVDTVAGRALFPGYSGELWLRGPTIMQGFKSIISICLLILINLHLLIDQSSDNVKAFYLKSVR